MGADCRGTCAGERERWELTVEVRALGRGRDGS